MRRPRDRADVEEGTLRREFARRHGGRERRGWIECQRRQPTCRRERNSQKNGPHSVKTGHRSCAEGAPVRFAFRVKDAWWLALRHLGKLV
jgi:hypothetical protein